MLLSPGDQFFSLPFLVIFGKGNLTFFSLLEKLREDVATAPFQLGPPLEVKYLWSCFKISNQSIYSGFSVIQSSGLGLAPEPDQVNDESHLKAVETSSVSYEDVLATTVINKVRPLTENCFPRSTITLKAIASILHQGSFNEIALNLPR